MAKAYKVAKKALIFDLDNTIYPVPQYGDEMFSSFMRLVTASGEQSAHAEDIKKDIMRTAFQKVADKYNFSRVLRMQADELLRKLTYDAPMKPFDDYRLLRDLACRKYLVTAGYTIFQESKISSLGVRGDFDEIHIVDVSLTAKTKKDVFGDILRRNGLAAAEALVIGDDPASEIAAGQELGIAAVLYDKLDFYRDDAPCPRIRDYRQLNDFL